MKTVLHSSILLGLTASFITTSNAQAASAWVQTYNYKKLNGTRLLSQIVTPDGTDAAYNLNERVNNVKFTTPATNTGGNLREFFWPENSPVGMDQMSCAVWSKQTGEGGQITQQGAVLRMQQTETSTRGITVTKNIWMGGTWIFNVHVWDTSREHAYTQIGGFDMSEYDPDGVGSAEPEIILGKMWYDEEQNFHSNLKPFPWHFCARTVGNKLQFKVWTAEVAQPSWNDSKYVRELQIPEEWNQPGKAGWYIGHLKPGHTAEFQNLRISYRGLQ